MAEKAETGFKCELKVEDVRLWSTWDHGYPWMYQAELTLSRGKDILSSRTTNFAFRDIQIERNEKITRFWLNNRKLYIRGTSYFPDCYISAMTKERYLRDLLNVKAAGFNLVRVHVHLWRKIRDLLCTGKYRRWIRADRSSRVLSAKTICLAGTAIIIWVLYAVENMQIFMSRQKS